MLGTRSEDDFEKVSTTNTNTVLDYGSQTQIEDPPHASHSMCCWKVLRAKVGDRTKAQILLIKTHCSFQICIFCLTVLCSEAIISEEVIFRLTVFSGIGDRWAVVNSS